MQQLCGYKGHDASVGLFEPSAESGGGEAERQLRLLQADQETCWGGVEDWCRQRLGDDSEQVKACMVSVCIVHAQ